MTLFEIASGGNLEELKQIVEYDCQDFHARDAEGNTVLHAAVRSGSLACVRYLTDCLAMDPLDANLSGKTPMDLAIQGGNGEILAFFEARTGVSADKMFHNPVLRGFYPDPSWIRVGQDYYMVNSTFCFFPCIPISHSRDLVHWTTVGYAITDPQWAKVYRSEGGRGYWAPDISYDPYSGRYFITATYRGNETDAEPRCQMVVSAERPEDPYDEPTWIHEDGIDPSIFHDTDGRHYMLLNRSVRLMELSADCRSAVGKPKLIWGGDWKIKTEGPQMMKHNGYYYLLAAEGGTGCGHRISAARSRNIWGPYENCPYNPILRQNDTRGYLQNCGHGKLLQLEDGRWYVCYLCLRRDGETAPMGRETSIAEITWTPDGWPIVANGRRPAAVVPLPVPADGTAGTRRAAGLVDWKGGEWLAPRALDAANVSVQGQDLLLRGNGQDLWQLGGQGTLVVRQQERAFAAETQAELSCLDAAEQGGSMGLTCYYDEHSYIKFGVQKTASGPVLLYEEYVGEALLAAQTWPLDAAGAAVRLRVEAARGERGFSWRSGSGDWQTVKTIPEPRWLSSEGLKYGKRFTGATVGVYVHGRFTARFTDWSAAWVRPEETAER